MNYYSIVLFTLLSFITACGGGSGGEEAQPTAVVVSEPPPPLQTIDLTAPDNFAYQTSKIVTLSIQIDELSSTRSYVSVFSDYQINAQGSWVPDFDSRLVFEKLTTGNLNREIKLPNYIERVLIQVWTVGASSGPLVYEAAIESDRVNWSR